jgi:hypothetical protein
MDRCINNSIHSRKMSLKEPSWGIFHLIYYLRLLNYMEELRNVKRELYS